MRHFSYVRCVWFFAFALITPVTLCAETLPNFVGHHLSEIKAEVETKDITLEILRVDSPEHRGEILQQIPAGGSEIGTGRMVFLKVSDGLRVPQLRGLSEVDAERLVHHHGINSEVTWGLHIGVPKDIVADQIPEAGTRIDASLQIIFLDVSDSPGIRVPELRNISHYEALKILTNFGLTGRIEPPNFQSSSGGICAGADYGSRVTASEPESGTFVKPGAQIVVRYKTFVRSRWSGQCNSQGIPY